MCGNISVRGDAVANVMSASCHSRFRTDDKFPILQIHKGAISIGSFSQLNIEPAGHRHIDVICLECGHRLLLYASKKGAFCQFREPTFSLVYGSLPADNFLAETSGGTIPRAMRPLFRDKQFDTLVCEDGDASKDGTTGASQEADNDYELMFSNSANPFVGSYSESGQFTTGTDYLVFLE